MHRYLRKITNIILICNGKGTKKSYKNHYIHEGEFTNGSATGHGTRKYGLNGDMGVYTGQWVDDKRNGKGKFIYGSYFTKTAGDVYDGEWLDDKKTAKGKITYANGDTFEGYFLNGLKNGPGKYKFKTGLEYDQTFENGWQVGNKSDKKIKVYTE